MEIALILDGFFLGASLIIAIGSQNAFVLQQGILRQYVFLVTTICFLSDSFLIILGGLGVGELISQHSGLLSIFSYLGATYLFIYGAIKLKHSFKKHSLHSLRPNSAQLIHGKNNKRSILLQTLAFTFLNPHVYLDTVILIGSFAANHPLEKRVFFLLGSGLASMIWFYSLGYLSTKLSPYLSKPTVWRVINFFIAIIMFYIGINFFYLA